MFAAARVGLGALGILTEVTLRCVPSFALAAEGPEPVRHVIARFGELAARNDHCRTRLYFALFESIVANVGGRPHRGKMHSLDAGRLRELYPRFGDFIRVRDEADPAGRFTNPYLDRVLGPPPGRAGCAGLPADRPG